MMIPLQPGAIPETAEPARPNMMLATWVHEQRNLRIPRLHFLDEVQPVLVAERKVDDHQIRLALAQGNQRGRARADGRVDAEAGVGLDEGGQPPAQDGVVVHNEKPFSRGADRFSLGGEHLRRPYTIR